MTNELEDCKELILILHDAPDSQFDGRARDTCIERTKTAGSIEELCTVVHDTLDACVHGGLASSFVITHLDFVWKRLGGTGVRHGLTVTKLT